VARKAPFLASFGPWSASTLLQPIQRLSAGEFASTLGTPDPPAGSSLPPGDPVVRSCMRGCGINASSRYPHHAHSIAPGISKDRSPFGKLAVVRVRLALRNERQKRLATVCVDIGGYYPPRAWRVAELDSSNRPAGRRPCRRVFSNNCL